MSAWLRWARCQKAIKLVRRTSDGGWCVEVGEFLGRMLSRDWWWTLCQWFLCFLGTLTEGSVKISPIFRGISMMFLSLVETLNLRGLFLECLGKMIQLLMGWINWRNIVRFIRNYDWCLYDPVDANLPKRLFHAGLLILYCHLQQYK